MLTLVIVSNSWMLVFDCWNVFVPCLVEVLNDTVISRVYYHSVYLYFGWFKFAIRLFLLHDFEDFSWWSLRKIIHFINYYWFCKPPGMVEIFIYYTYSSWIRRRISSTTEIICTDFVRFFWELLLQKSSIHTSNQLSIQENCFFCSFKFITFFS